jgi:predicted RNase H-like HicB family nuclease
VLGVSAAADTLAEALERAYEAIEKIQFEGFISGGISGIGR